jgi:Uma2 family endonuclease
MPATLDRPKTIVDTKTFDDLDALPDDGVRRWLHFGKIKEIGMTKRNRTHANNEARFVLLLGEWLSTQPKPHPEIFSGEAGIILARNPDLVVGADVALISPAVMAAQSASLTTMIEGNPTLIVEIASPSDTFETWHDKITSYKKVGVPVSLIVNPYERTVGIHRPGQPPVVLNETQMLDLSPELPEFSVSVKRVFDGN